MKKYCRLTVKIYRVKCSIHTQRINTSHLTTCQLTNHGRTNTRTNANLPLPFPEEIFNPDYSIENFGLMHNPG